MVGRDPFYAAFFCRAYMERTMQLKDDVVRWACGRMMYSSTSAVSEQRRGTVLTF